jgi:S-(hydroxymethyl)glutathione dehydrogenase / alcohol dehydrogenase
VKTRAALFYGPDQPINIETIDIEAPHDDDVLVRIVAAGVCGSDLHVIRGEWSRPTPMVLGHEGAGIVEAVGDRVEGLAVGDAVMLSWAPSCQECGSCLRGRPAACGRLRDAIGAGTLVDGTTRLSKNGEPVYRMTALAAFAEYVVLPARSAVKIPAGVPLREAALVGCAALTGVGAVENVAAPAPGARAVVIGAGAIGQFVIQALRIAGAAQIVAVDPNESRRDRATELGATQVVSPDELESIVESMPEAFDRSYDAVGGPQAAATALAAIRSGGTAVIIGLSKPGQRVEVDPIDMVVHEKTLVGSIYGSGDPVEMGGRLLSRIADRTLTIEGMIGETFALEDINDAVNLALAGTGGRVLVIPDPESAA